MDESDAAQTPREELYRVLSILNTGAVALPAGDWSLLATTCTQRLVALSDYLYPVTACL